MGSRSGQRARPFVRRLLRLGAWADGWKVDFIGDDAVRVTVVGGADLNEEEAIERARSVMVQLTAYGTRGGGRSANNYDAASNGNFDDDLLDTWH